MMKWSRPIRWGIKIHFEILYNFWAREKFCRFKMYFKFSTSDLYVRHVYIKPVHSSRIGIDLVVPEGMTIPPHSTAQVDLKLRAKLFKHKFIFWPKRRSAFFVVPKQRFNNLVVAPIVVNPDFNKTLKLTCFNIGVREIRLGPGDRIAVLIAPNFKAASFGW